MPEEYGFLARFGLGIRYIFGAAVIGCCNGLMHPNFKASTKLCLYKLIIILSLSVFPKSKGLVGKSLLHIDDRILLIAASSTIQPT